MMSLRKFSGPILLLSLIILGACNPPNSTDENAQASAGNNEQSFDLEVAKQDYLDTPLQVVDVSERNRDGKNALALTLSVPLNPRQNHQTYFKVTDPQGVNVEGAWILSGSAKTLWFPHVEPNQQYKVSVQRGLVAATGASLSDNFSTELTTRHLNPSVSFVSDGSFLAQGLSKGLPIAAVNVEQVNIDFFRISDDHINDFLATVDNYKGRYYWNLENLTRLGELRYSARYDLQIPRNTQAQRTIAIGDKAEFKQAGIYLAIMMPAGSYDNKQITWFTVTDMGMHARVYDKQLEVHLSSLSSSTALENINVQLLDNKNRLIEEGLTTAQGMVSFSNLNDEVDTIVARSGQQLSLIEMRKPALDLSSFDLGQSPQLPIELFIYSPRDLYRPGELVHFNALIRDFDGNATKAAVLSGVLKSPDGSEVKAFKWASQQGGYYHFAWQIPGDAATGDWNLSVTGPFKQAVTYGFKVEEFLPERMKLSFNPSTTIVGADETVQVPVLGEYLYGAPASDNRLSTLVDVRPKRHPVIALPEYYFGNETENGLVQQFSIDDVNLDKKGLAQLNINSRWSDVGTPLQLKLISSLYESGGRPVTRSHSVLVWPKTALIGIKPSFTDENSAENTRVDFDIVSVLSGGVKQAANDVQVKLVREDRQYFWVYDDSQGWHYQWTDKEYVEASKSVDIAEGSSTSVAFSVGWGSYRLEVVDTSADVTSTLRFYAGTNWYNDWRASQQGIAKPDQVILALDKGSYKTGEVAKLTIVPPHAGTALIMVEADGPLWMQHIELPATGATIEIPIAKDWQQHNTYLTAMVLRAGDKTAAVSPKRSFGLLHLPLSREQRRLGIDIEVADKVQPNSTLSTKVNIQNSAGEQVYLTLAAVDVGVLSISGFETPDPFTGFFGQRRYSVDSHDMYDKLIELSQAPGAKLRFGGDMAMTRGGSEPQSDVQIVSLFSGLVSVDDNNQADIKLQLPDFNGRLRLMALAFSETHFGSAEQELLVAAPVVTQLSKPRFLAMGDEASLALDIHNLSGQPQDLTVVLSVTGAVELDDNKQSLNLADGEKTTLRYPIKATHYAGLGDIYLTVEGDGIDEVKRQWSLGVRAAYPAIVRHQQELLAADKTFELNDELISQLLPETLIGAVSVSAQADLQLDHQLQNLMAYPYGCLEQTTSVAYPLSFATPQMQKRFSITSVTEAVRVQMISQGIDRIAGMQLRNGGFGLWSNRSSEEHWLTAYVADFLVSARAMGVVVSPSVLDKTLKRLQNYVNYSGRLVSERWSDDANHYNFAYKAYAAYVLSRVDKAPLGSLRSLYDNRFKQAKTGLSQLQLALALKRAGDNKRGDAALAVALDNLPSRYNYWGDYGSAIRDRAMMIHLLFENKVAIDSAIAMSFDLAGLLKTKQWLSTQERNALFLAGIALQNNNEQSWQAELMLGAAREPISGGNNVQRSFNYNQAKQGIAVNNTAGQPLFVKAQISGHGITAPAPMSNGLTVQRTWYRRNGEPVILDEVKVGELYVIHLEVGAQQRSPDALVVDLLPAGFELENQNLDTAIKLENFLIQGETIANLTRYNQVKHQEYRDDRFVSAVDLNRYRNAHLFYLLRAVTPGQYQVPTPLVEDMYRPELRAIGLGSPVITISNP